MVQQSSSNSEWPLRMSSQDALLNHPHGASQQQLLVDGGGARSVSPAGSGSQLLQQQFPPPPPPEPWTQHLPPPPQQQQPPRGQFANVMGGTLGRHAPMVHGGHGAAGGGLQGGPSGPSNMPNIQQYPSTFRGGNTNSYPLYHTCERPTNKKRVTIVEDNNTESSV